MIRFGKIAVIAISILVAMVSCERDSDSAENAGMIKLYLTDAPLDTDGITGVFITFTEIHYHTPDNSWQVFDEFDEPVTINLLDLTRGETELLGFFELQPGTYTQLRFMLEAPERGQGPPFTPGAYLEFEDGSTQNLFVPSGSASGFKAIGRFDVPANGIIEVTADFDVRRSVVRAGNSGKYILKPTIRLVVNDQAGRIRGEVLNIPDNMGVVVYAYESGTYTDSEADEPGDEEIRFSNAVNSDMVSADNQYHIDFLLAGYYDLVVVATQNGEFFEVLGLVEEVEVVAGQTTTLDIDIEEL